MLKRIAVLSLLLTYLATSAGFAVNLHFCGKKLEEVKINAPAGKQCCKGISKKKDTCCKNQKLDVKVSDKQTAGVSLKVSTPCALSLFSPVAYLITAGTISKNSIWLSYTSPPLRTPVQIIVMNSVFRI